MNTPLVISHNRFLVIGRAGMDIYPDPPGTQIETATRLVAHLGGSSGNIAVAVVRHGGTADLITCVADDAIGRFTLNSLDQYNVGCAHVRPVGGQSRNTVAVLESRVENHQSVIYRNGAADIAMTKEDVERPDYTDYGALIVTGTALVDEPSRSAVFRAFELAGAAALPVIFDIDHRPYTWPSLRKAGEMYARAADMCDVIVGNDDEFGVLAGGYENGLGRARELARKGSRRIVVYKMGENGAHTITADGEFRTGVYSVRALKPTGAGDGFMGGFASALATGYALRDAVLRGSACAAIVVSRVGCAPAMPTRVELEEFLRTHPEPA